ncbi:amidohydrolase family protein [bacterium]|nr:amidohydrolase family protein [bacterium]
MGRTLIKASHIIAFDGVGHRYVLDGHLVYEGDSILYVGPSYQGEVDAVIDAGSKVVSPGFINTHVHMQHSPLDRSFVENGGSPEFGGDTLIDFLMPRNRVMDPSMRRVCTEFSLAEVLRSGTTTCVEIGDDIDDLVDLVPRYGNRIYFAPMFRSADWFSPDGLSVDYAWKEDEGQEDLDRVAGWVRDFDGAADGLLRGMLCPAQADTCTEALLLRARDHARDLGVPMTIHTAQSEYETANMVARTGKTPVAWMHDIDFLGSDVILAHAIYLSGTKWTDLPAGDIEIIAESGASIAHAPWVFCRDGMAMDSFRRYQQAGINMTLGTDTCPQNMIQSMRLASIFSKSVENDPWATTPADVFNAATLGGAKALGREDLGRLSAGAKADIVIFSGDSMNMVPLRDPVTNIVFNAEMEDVETVIINGKTVLEDGRVTGLGDRAADLHAEMQKVARKVWSRIEGEDRLGRTVNQLSPLSFDCWDGVADGGV